MRTPKNITLAQLMGLFLSGTVALHSADSRAGSAVWNVVSNSPSFWTNSANWTPNTVPNATDDVASVTNNMTVAMAINLNQGIVVGTLNIGDGVTPFVAVTIASNTANGALTFAATSPGNAAINKTPGNTATDTISAGITLSSPLTISSTNGGLTLSGSIGESSPGMSITRQNTGGTVTLSGNNTFSGGVVLMGGTLSLGSATALGAATGTFTIAGGTIDAPVAVTVTNNNAQVWSGDFAFAGTADLNLGSGSVDMGGGARTLTVNGSRKLTVGGAISNGAGLTKAGTSTGALVLGGANTYTGATIVTSGILILSNSMALPGGIDATGGVSGLTINGGVVGLGAGDFLRGLGAADDQVQWAAGGGFAAVGADRAVNLGGSAAPVTWGAGAFVPDGRPLILGSTYADRTVDLQNPIYLGGASRTNQIDLGTAPVYDAVLSGLLSGDAGGVLVKAGAGRLLLANSANTYAGGTSVGGGTLAFANGALGGGNVTLTAASTLKWHGSNTEDISSRLSVSSFAATLDSNSNNVTFASAVAGTSGGLTKTGAGTLTLGAGQTLSGPITVAGGTLAYGVDNALGTNGITVNGNNAVLDVGAYTDSVGTVTLTAGSIVGSGMLGSAAGFVMNNAAACTCTVVLAGTGGLTKSGAGVLTLPATNTFSGQLWIQDGRISLGVLDDTHSGAGTIRLGSGTATGELEYTGGDSVILSRPIDLAGTTGGGRVTVSGAGTLELTGFTCSGAGAKALTLQGVNGGTVSAAITNGSAATSLTKAGGGRWVLTGSNAYSGVTTISGGTLQIGDGGGVGNLGTNATANAGALVFNRSNTVTYAGVISGTGSVSQAGSGALILAGANVHSGPTAVNAGTLAYGINNAIGSGAVQVAGGTLDVGVYTDSVGMVTLASGTIVGTSGKLAATSYTVESGAVSASLTGGAGLVKRTGGTVVLSGANTYAGITLISNGTLRVANGSGSATGTNVVNVDGGILAGTGTCSGTVSNKNGGTVTPGETGTAGGVLTLGRLVLVPGCTNVFEFDATPTNDTIAVTETNGLVINGGGVYLYNPVDQSDWSNGVYRLIQYAGGIGGTGVSALSVLNPPPGKTIAFGVSSGCVVVAVSSDKTWTGDAAPVSLGWTTSSNWVGGVAPVPAETPRLIFTGNTGTVNTNDFPAGSRFGGLVFDGNAGAFVLNGGNSLNLAGEIVNASPNLQTLNLPLVLELGDRTFNAASNDLVVGGAVDDGGDGLGVRKTGSRALTLSAANTYTGPTTVADGLLTLGAGGSLHAGSAVSVNGTTAVLSGTGAANGTVTLNGGTIAPGVEHAAGGTLTVGNLTLNSGSLAFEFDSTPTNDAVDVAGTLTLNGGGVYLYRASDHARWAAHGTYRLIKYAALIGSPSSLTVLNPEWAEAYSFGTDAGWLTVTIGTSAITWDGGGTNNLASNPTNWVGDAGPVNGSYVTLDATSQKAMTWDLTNVSLSAWTQIGYTNVVTIMTRFPGQGAFTNLRIAGDCVISNGTWTHPANTGNNTEVDRLSVTVEGAFILASNATIDVTGRGYAAQRGPGAGVSAHRYYSWPGSGASHGGEGGYDVGATPAPTTYGSVTAPVDLGSGSSDRGGGAVELKVSGMATVDGRIAAVGNPMGQWCGAAGGSIYIVAGALNGAGTLDASGGGPGCYWGGGGGRIAVIVTNSDSFGSVKMLAYGAANNVPAAAGTIYRESQSQGPGRGTVTVDNNNSAVGPDTVVPPGLPDTSPQWVISNEISFASLVVTNKASVRLSDDMRMQDLAWLAAATRLELNDYNLFLRTNEHAFGTGTVVSNYGRIFWNDTNALYYLRVTCGPHGTATTEQTGWYPLDTSVSVGAGPDDGYAFVRWDGNLPVSEQTNPTPSVVMNQQWSLRALFASTDPDVRTWMGFTNSSASSAANWYPAVLPTNGSTIVLDATCPSSLTWNLDQTLGAWLQETGYTGVVTIRTKYPGQGTFTNLAITGDCVVLGGSWTHLTNTGASVAADRLKVTVGGDFTLGSNTVIALQGKGFAAASGPGAGNSLLRSTASGVAASHGGRGGVGSGAVPANTYDSIIAPSNLGSSAYGTGGGGNLELGVGGAATIDGVIQASAVQVDVAYPGSAGGSIYITAGSVAGSGSLSASGGSGYQSGGGGRIAVVVTNSDSFGNLAMAAAGGGSSISAKGAAGTIYRRGKSDKPGAGQLVIDNGNLSTPTNVYTALGDGTWDLRGVTMTLTNRACVGLLSNAVMRDLWLRTNTPTRLYLNGYTLRLLTEYHADWGHTNWVVYNDGQILWRTPGSVLMLR